MASAEPAQQQTAATAAVAGPSTRPLLLPELLGFSPQLLLDDIINISNNAVQDGVNGMEEFLQNWTDNRIAYTHDDAEAERNIQEVEQGLVAFQTLLEHHTDIAFDFFEAWSLRNIFAVPPDLEVVLPHQEGLDLTVDAEGAERKERELIEEIDELRKKIKVQQLYKRKLTLARRVATSRHKLASSRLTSITALVPPPLLDSLTDLPKQLLTLYEHVSSLPPLEPAVAASLALTPEPEAGKRPWETSKTGYLNWALARLMERARDSGSEEEIAKLREMGEAVGTVGALKKAMGEYEAFRQSARASDEAMEDG